MVYLTHHSTYKAAPARLIYYLINYIVMKVSISTTQICITAAFILLLNFASHAKTPQGINYQAVVRNSTGAIMPNQHVNMRFSIHRDSLAGDVVYIETDSVVTTPDGIFTVIIGGGNIVSGNFDTIRWGACGTFLQVEMDITGGTNYLNMGTSQLVSVPYALYAKTAGAVDLAPTMYPTISGNDTINVGTNGYLILNSTVPASSAQVALTAGVHPGQILCIVGMGAANTGVRFNNGGLLNIGTGGNHDIQPGSMLMLMWSGYQWLQVAYSANQ